MSASTVATAYYTANGTGPLHPMGSGATAGRPRKMVVPYTTTAIESGSTINIAYLPKGAILTKVEAHIEGNASSSTLKLTYGSDDIVAATSIATNDVILYANLQALDGAASTAATLLKATTGGATLTASKAMVFIIEYVLD